MLVRSLGNMLLAIVSALANYNYVRIEMVTDNSKQPVVHAVRCSGGICIRHTTSAPSKAGAR